jgi:hypothetical protein
MHRSVWRSVILAVLVALSGSTTSARTVHRTCRDGATSSPADQRFPVVGCDLDGQCDGVCTFGVREACLACLGCPCPVTGALVRAGQKRVMRLRPGLRLVLRCQPHGDAACPVPECATDADCPVVVSGGVACARHRSCVEGRCVTDQAEPRCVLAPITPTRR